MVSKINLLGVLLCTFLLVPCLHGEQQSETTQATDEEMDDLFHFGEDELIVSVTKLERSVATAPGTVTVITRRELEEMGAQSLGDAVRFIASMEIIPKQTTTNALYFRGIYNVFNQAVLLLIDGRPLNDNFFGTFYADYKTPLDNVKRIEVIRGPGSALWGPNAFAAVINIVTLDGEDINGVEANAGLGSYNTHRYNVLVGQKRRELDYAVSLRSFNTDGPEPEKPSSNMLDPSFEWENMEHNDFDLQAKLGYKNLTTRFGVNSYDAGRIGFPTFETPEDRDRFNRYFFDMEYKYPASEKVTVNFRANSQYVDGERKTRKELYALQKADGLPDTTPVFIFTQEHLNLLSDCLEEHGNINDCLPLILSLLPQARPGDINEAQQNYYIPMEEIIKAVSGDYPVVTQDETQSRSIGDISVQVNISPKQTLTAGAEFRYDTIDQQEVSGEHSSSLVSVFLQDDIKLGESWYLLAGARFDYHSIYDSFLSPRLSIVYKPNPQFTIRASLARAFRAPSFTELYADFRLKSTTVEGNIDLEPEKITFGEVSLDYTPNRFFKTIVNFYKYKVSDFITYSIEYRDLYFYVDLAGSPILAFVEDGPTAGVPVHSLFSNVKDRHAIGFEIELQSNITSYLSLWGGYYARRQLFFEETAENALREFDIFTDGANIGLEIHYKDYFFSTYRHHFAGINYNDEMPVTLTSNVYNVELQNSHMDYATMTIGGRYRGFTLSATLWNVFNNKYSNYDDVYNDGLPMKIANNEIWGLVQLKYVYKF